jgi:hypothetical protein
VTAWKARTWMEEVEEIGEEKNIISVHGRHL